MKKMYQILKLYHHSLSPFKFIYINLILILLCDFVYCNLRSKRFLTFPPTSPTRVQIIAGIGFPVELKFEDVILGYVLKAEYFLPENASNYIDLFRQPFEPTFLQTGNYARRSIHDDDIKKNYINNNNDYNNNNNNNNNNDNNNNNINNNDKNNIKSEQGYDQILEQKYEKYTVEAIEVKDNDTTIDKENKLNENTNNNNNNNDNNNNNINNNDKNNIKSEQGYDEILEQKYEKYTVEAIEVKDNDTTIDKENKLNENTNNNNNKVTMDIHTDLDLDWQPTGVKQLKQSQNLETSRWTLYKGIELLANSKGLVGRACVLRSICEAAQAPFTYTSGILGELMHIVMSPSTSADKIFHHSDNEYLKAEKLGQMDEPCDKIFKECTQSLLDQFSGVYSTMENIFKFIG